MQVPEFLEKIKQNPDSPLLFEFEPGRVVPGGYHVTEIKNAGYETIDCGNSLHTWKEVIVQVWVPEEATADDEWMPSAKFMKIWDVVDSRLLLAQDAEIRIEYGDAEHRTANYQVDGLVATEDGLVVQMAPPRTMCKPREILIPFSNGSATAADELACCTPSSEPGSSRIEKVLPLPVAVGGSSCCTPAAESESSCCS